MANFSIATSEKFKNREGNTVERTEWHNIVMWRGLAEIAEKWLKKGSQIYVEGRLRTRSWDDQNGNKKYTTEVLVDNMTMLGGASGGSGGSNSGGGQQSSAPSSNQNQVNEPASSLDDIDDDLPF